MVRSLSVLSFVVGAVLLGTGCSGSSSSNSGSSGPTDENPNGAPEGAAIARSELRRELNPDVPEVDAHALVDGNTAFALGLYREVREGTEGNLLLAPYSISTAMAMAYAGAAGSTATQMAAALHFELPEERLHAALNQLDLELDGRSVRLDTVNQAFAQQGWPFLDSYLDLLATNYDAGLMLVDFASQTEQARKTVNDWVSAQTERKIPEILPKGSVDSLTALVLANAVYFKADWLNEFDDANTRGVNFVRADGTTVLTQMMHRQAELGYAEGDGWQAVGIPYAGEEIEFVAVLPATSAPDWDRELDAAALSAVIGSLAPEELSLGLPRFTFDFPVDLVPPLKNLGMVDAFDSSIADFSGMDGTKELHISAVLHQTYIDVDEQGTEAAGSTAVVLSKRSADPEIKSITFDRPFMVLIRDVGTGTVLFLGRVAEPR